ncbi:LLM class flavin-dependent oxidoreductase [Paenibacillus sp. IB182496]|uniref:LLM class flavin-dependent oxidoreductase n=1 Tax=Paenibacillus sabuli TaxID=2772509 RepID=A0A927GQZ0_9BACL|nr:LLM class flavin-dependent oxidoreductase [Paenibacillus sabuli]MBD2844262.1 LLM class flavin-dependent oxidoreductase [Paenibacillus sabuli]
MTLTMGILDQSIVFPGQTPGEALRNTVRLARLADRLGYARYWVAEHHDGTQTAGSAPEVLIGHLLASTERIKIGSGGVMLQHYSAYKVAECFNVLATLAPGRVELGIGRAPGGLPRSTQALRSGKSAPPPLAEQVDDLRRYLHGPAEPGHPLAGLQAAPLTEQPAELYMLGTSVASARLAADKGLPYVFARFINSDHETAREAIDTYRSHFLRTHGRPPRPMLALAVIITEDEEEAESLKGQHQSVRVTLAGGQTVNVGSLEQAEEYARQAGEAYTTEVRDADVTIGTEERVRARLLELQREFGVDEMLFTAIIGDYAKRERSFTRLIRLFDTADMAGKQAAGEEGQTCG